MINGQNEGEADAVGQQNGSQRAEVMNGHSNPALPNPAWYDGIRGMLSTKASWSESEERSLLAPYDYLDANPGHRIRSQLIQVFDYWFKVPSEKVARIDKIVQMAHTSSLLIDDIEDGSQLRRGQPAAHVVFGMPLTLNAANYIYFLFFSELVAVADLQIAGHQSLVTGDQMLRMLIEEMVNLHRGQGIDLYLRDNAICPTEEAYVKMVNNKTGGLLRIVLRLMAGQSSSLRSAEEGEELVPLVNLIGLLYQIRDDYMNLRSGDYTQNKGYCDDLSEGKFSFPVIHALKYSKFLETDADKANTDVPHTSSASPSSTFVNADHASAKLVKQLQQIKNDIVAAGSPDSIEDSDPELEPKAFEIHHGSPFTPASTTADQRAEPIDEPLICIRSHADLVAALRAHPRDAPRKRAIVEYMQDTTNSFQYTCDVLLRVDRLVRQEMKRVEGLFDSQGGQNARLRAYVDLLRSGWYASSDCPAVDGQDTPPMSSA